VPFWRDCKSKAPGGICQPGRDHVPAVRNNTGHRGLCPSRRAIAGPFSAAEDSDPVKPYEPPHGRARRTVPLPGNRQIEGTPAHLIGREGPRPRGPLGCAHNGPLLPSRCPGHPAPCSGKRLRNALPGTNGRHGDRDMLCGLSFGRSPCPLCLCGLVLRAFVVGWQRRRFLRSQFFC
jgi:hypothetical protein